MNDNYLYQPEILAYLRHVVTKAEQLRKGWYYTGAVELTLEAEFR